MKMEMGETDMAYVVFRCFFNSLLVKNVLDFKYDKFVYCHKDWFLSPLSGRI